MDGLVLVLYEVVEASVEAVDAVQIGDPRDGPRYAQIILLGSATERSRLCSTSATSSTIT